MALALALGPRAPFVFARDVDVLDLGDYCLESGGVVRLTGPWDFWWERLVDPAADPPPAPDGTIVLPGVWNHWTPEDQVGVRAGGSPWADGQGFATYGRTIVLSPDAGEVALFVPPASTAYRLYANGALVAESGSPGTIAEQTEPLYRMRTVVIRPQDSILRLVAHVSNFHHRRGGLWRPIVMGTPEDVDAWVALEVVYDLLLAGGLLLMALYLMALHASGPREPEALVPLFAALFFVALTVRVLVTGQMIATRIWTGLSWAVQLRIEYLAGHVALATFVWLFRSAFPERFPRWFAVSGSLYALGNAVAVVALPLLSYSRFVPVYAVSMNIVFLSVTTVVLVAAVRGDSGARIYLAGSLLALLSAMGEAVPVSPFFASREMVPLSSLVRLMAAGSMSERTLQVISVVGSLLLVFVAAVVIVLRTSRTLMERIVHSAVPSVRADLMESPDAITRARQRLVSAYRVTAREFEIAGLVARGLSNTQIAERLFVSVPTVKTHLYNLMRKTGVGNRHELAMLYLGSLVGSAETDDFIPK
ncbi:MAG: LuxR C-terminal-related transcriptional regulator [Spirochaetota bacterium]